MTGKQPSMRLARRTTHAPLTKSEQMARVRSSNTDAELVLRRALWQRGLRFRVTYRTLPGSPDVAFTRWRLAVFVDGCFWHGCPVHYTLPKANRSFWKSKKARNCARDARIDGELRTRDWTVLRVWEHDVYDTIEAVVCRVLQALAANGKTLPITG